MTPEELWKSLEPQIEAMERELMSREAITEAMSEAIITGSGYYTVATDYGDVLAELRSMRGTRPIIMIVDECEPLMSEELHKIIDELKANRAMIDDRLIIIGGAGQLSPTRRRAGSLGFAALAMSMAESLACCAPDPIIFADPPPVNPWHPKTLSKKNYAAPRQSFRGRMRSVNRNR